MKFTTKKPKKYCGRNTIQFKLLINKLRYLLKIVSISGPSPIFLFNGFHVDLNILININADTNGCPVDDASCFKTLDKWNKCNDEANKCDTTQIKKTLENIMSDGV